MTFGANEAVHPTDLQKKLSKEVAELDGSVAQLVIKPETLFHFRVAAAHEAS
jgi:hypothetical protein